MLPVTDHECMIDGPAAAAELLDLGLGLGGATPTRQIRLASFHVAAGNPGQARGLLRQAIASWRPGYFVQARLCCWQ